MITIYLNDQPLNVVSNCSLYDLLLQQHSIKEHIALALNKQFVPRATTPSILLKEGDRIDLIVPMQGG